MLRAKLRSRHVCNVRHTHACKCCAHLPRECATRDVTFGPLCTTYFIRSKRVPMCKSKTKNMSDRRKGMYNVHTLPAPHIGRAQTTSSHEIANDSLKHYVWDRCKVPQCFHHTSFIVWWTLKNRQDTFLCFVCQVTAVNVLLRNTWVFETFKNVTPVFAQTWPRIQALLNFWCLFHGRRQDFEGGHFLKTRSISISLFLCSGFSRSISKIYLKGGRSRYLTQDIEVSKSNIPCYAAGARKISMMSAGLVTHHIHAPHSRLIHVSSANPTQMLPPSPSL
jgi:hypothetical protein